ncbi:MAG: FadR family transcriptional regulator [Granulosicoccus sp.]|nr:FadR family transcriptional regulator [Granulosicoccus sp.]
MIEKAGLTVGDRLPAENELSNQLGVGRSTIREALKAWQSMGIVTRNKGAGTVLAVEISANSVHVPITLKLEAESLLRTNGVRRPLEIEAVRLAAMNATDLQRQSILDYADRLLGEHAAGRNWRKTDRLFHATIHDACGNPLFGQLIGQIHRVFHDIYEEPLGTPLLGESSITLHGKLAEALVAGNVATAVQYMLEISCIVDEEVRKHIDE